MRIAFVINSLAFGGAETQLITLSREIAARQHDVMICTLRGDNPRAHELAATTVTLSIDQKFWKFDPRLVWRLRKKILDFRAQVVHGMLIDGNLHARLATIGTGIPNLSSERNADYQLPLRHEIALFLTRRLTSGIVANSHAGLQFAKKKFRLPETEYHVVWNGFDLTSVQRVEGKSNLAAEFFGLADAKVACLVGMIKPQKDYQLALSVAAALKRRSDGWKVLLVGDALRHTQDYKKAMFQQARQMGVADTVCFTGIRADVMRLVRSADVLFSTSAHEGFPNVVLEAMAVGTPVVSTEYSDIRQILPEPFQVVSNRSPETLAEAIIVASNDRQRIGRLQLAWLQENATISVVADRLLEIYSRYIVRSRQSLVTRNHRS